MNNKSIKIFATVGPSSISQRVLSSFKDRGVDYIRINLSHTPLEKIDPILKRMLKTDMKVVIDTEGSQVRTGDLGKIPLIFKEGDEISIFNIPIKSNNKQFYVRPKEFVNFLTPGSLISVDFDSVLLKVSNVDFLKSKGCIRAQVIIGGTVMSNRAVHSDAISKLNPFSDKDLFAIDLAKKNGIRYFTLSYIDNADEVKEFKKLYQKAITYSKIETKMGVINFEEILKISDGILIDRGDLEREIPMGKIPFLQKAIIKKSNDYKKPVFIATNILETMCDHLKPTRSEISDIVNALLDGVDGFVLTKETAIGKYPIETVNVLKGVIAQKGDGFDFSTRSLLAISDNKISGNLIEPHGGLLVNRYQVTDFSKAELKQFRKIHINEEILMDAELIAFGAYSPLEGFMNSQELNSVINKMRLPSGLPWTMPILLTVFKEEVRGVKNNEVIALADRLNNEIYATLNVEEIKKFDKSLLCRKWFGTDHKKHPGAARVLEGGDYLLAGKTNLLKRRLSPFKEYELTPSQTRKIFTEKDWLKVVGFHTRNPIHRSHEFIQIQALKNIAADGLFIHPVVGKKKKGDFDARVIIRVYELMLKKFYPKNKVVFAVYPTYSRYAGPREAVFTAICRKNYGCSHFIVGRDHTGVEDYYPPQASQEIFNKFPDLGIVPVFFNKVYFSKKLKRYVEEGLADEKEEERVSISGTKVRELFKKREKPTGWLMRPEIADEILKLDLEFKKNGKSIFVK